MSASGVSPKTPWHVWVVGVLDILAGCVFFVWYAVRARKAGHLR